MRVKKREKHGVLQEIRNLVIQIKRANLGEIPRVVLNTMDILYEDRIHKPLLIRDGVKPYENGWHFIYTLTEGCSYDEVESKINFFQSVVNDGIVEMKREGKFLHIDVNTFRFENMYRFDPEFIRNMLLKPKYNSYYMPLVVGIMRGGKYLVIDIAEIPHILVAGINKSGKSSWVKQACYTVAMTRPQAVICYIDFAGADALQLEDFAYVATEIPEAKIMLGALVGEVKKRLAYIKKHRISKIHNVPEFRPILVALDEITEMQDDECIESLNYLVRMSRKCGVDVVAGTQKPSHKTFKNFCESRSQFEARMCFRMSEAKDSHLVLGNNKAFDYIKPNNSGRGIWSWTEEELIHSLYISDEDIYNLNNSNFIYKKAERQVEILVEPQQNLWTLSR